MIANLPKEPLDKSELKRLWAKYESARAVGGRESEFEPPRQRAIVTKAFNRLTAEAEKHGDVIDIVFKLTNGMI